MNYPQEASVYKVFTLSVTTKQLQLGASQWKSTSIGYRSSRWMFSDGTCCNQVLQKAGIMMRLLIVFVEFGCYSNCCPFHDVI